ncbi:MAG: hypothetical protein JWQ38_1637 [Flavipsychrobacter sp.]|nr:hypothetical protein [Flavipsychrobacter sp.]
MPDITHKLSRYCWLLCVVIMCYSSFSVYPRWKKEATEATISWDVSGYYWYLPSLFIYHDLKHQGFESGLRAKYTPTYDFQQGTKTDNGNYVMKYSSGMAVMYSPFFFVAHLLAGPLGYPRDGLSTPYQLAVQLGGLLISLLGLWYLRKLLLLFYDDRTVAISLLLLVAASNYIELATIDAGMSHTWLFTVYVFLLWNTYHFYESPKLKYAIRIGLLIGLATLTRPTDIISCLIPLLWGMESIGIGAIKKKLSFLATNIKRLVAAGVCAVMVISIQLVYWKYVSGHWLVYSYGDQGFSFRHPNFQLYTLSYRTGWLIYTPLMAFAFIGIIPFLLRQKNKVAIVTFFLVNYYIVCSWNVWNYGGRAMVQSYPILMFPLAALVAVILSKRISQLIFLPVALLFVYMNAWAIYQHHIGKLYSPESMTKEYYWRVAGRWTAPEQTIFLRDNTDLYEGTPQNLRLIYQNDFEAMPDSAATIPVINGKHSLQINGRELIPRITIPFTGGNGMQWIRIEATFHCTSREWDEWAMTQFIARLKVTGEQDDSRVVPFNMLRVHRVLHDGETKNIALDMKLPSEHYDSLQIWINNTYSDKIVIMDDLKVSGFSEDPKALITVRH